MAEILGVSYNISSTWLALISTAVIIMFIYAWVTTKRSWIKNLLSLAIFGFVSYKFFDFTAGRTSLIIMIILYSVFVGICIVFYFMKEFIIREIEKSIW